MSEIQIQSHERATLGTTDLCQSDVVYASHGLVEDMHRVEPGEPEFLDGFAWQILVDLETGLARHVTRRRAGMEPPALEPARPHS
jgi:hypothetical protein